MELVVLGLSHRTAPVALREQLAVAADELKDQVRALLAVTGVLEGVLLSTCNRVEIYAAADDPELAVSGLTAHLGQRVSQRIVQSAQGQPQVDESLASHLYHHTGREAVRHLFRVAASLDSLVVGEPQVLGQLKDAYDSATHVGTVGSLLGLCFPRAFRVARRVRRDTDIARQSVSISSVAVELARQVFDGFNGRTVLLVGAGKMADLAARALRAQGAQVVVTNRTRARADELGARLGCEVEDFAALERALIRADVVITSTGARVPIITQALLEKVQRARHRRPLVLVDIAVPRDVEPAAANLEGVFVWDIDDLQKVAARNLDGRRKEAEKAEDVVADEVAKFFDAQRGRGVGPAITALRSHFMAVAHAEAERALSGLGGLDERGQREVQRMAEAIAAKLLHAPQVVLKREAKGEDGEQLVESLRRLFELPERPEPPERARPVTPNPPKDESPP